MALTEKTHTKLPAHMRPDRPEVICARGQGVVTQLFPGITQECVVGDHVGARNLSTSFITVEPNTQSPFHRHPVGKSVTVLSGDIEVEFPGRSYHLRAMDNITIPKEMAHRLVNKSTHADTAIHVSMCLAKPTHSLVEQQRDGTDSDQPAMDQPCGERVTYYATASRYEPSPNVTFIDHFNRDLVEGIEMSGGLGLFEPGGRLPAHLHDFDESICIVSGTAICLVESRRHTLSNCDTALEPRGRVHYFINETDAPMVMFWVYADPTPERIVVDERFAVEPCAAWPHDTPGQTSH